MLLSLLLFLGFGRGLAGVLLVFCAGFAVAWLWFCLGLTGGRLGFGSGFAMLF